jgi:hypothetical protein
VALLALLPAVVWADGGVADRVGLGETVVVAAGEVVGGNLVVLGGNAEVRGEVRGDVVVIGGSLYIGGPVGGQVVALGGPVTLANGARVERDLAVVGGELIQDGGLVAGRVDRIAPTLRPAQPSMAVVTTETDLRGSNLPQLLAVRGVQVGLLVALLIALGLGATLFFPGRIEVIGLTLQQAFWHSTLLGLLTLPLALLLVLLFVATLVGAPLGLVIGVFLAAGSAFGLVALAQDIGERVWESIFPRREPGGLATLAGLLLLLALILPLFAISPLVGAIGLWLVSLPGLGAVLLSRAGQKPPLVAEAHPR